MSQGVPSFDVLSILPERFRETKQRLVDKTDDFDVLSILPERFRPVAEPAVTQEAVPTPTGIDPLFQGQFSREQAEEQKPKGVFKVLDILQRPNFAIAGAVKALAEGDPKGVIREAGKGFFGKERDTFSDVLGVLGWNPQSRLGKIGKGVAGFALDVLTDPTTYIGVGALTKAGTLAQKGGKLAPTVAKQARLGQRALVQFMGKELVRGAGVFERSGQMLNFARATGVGDKLGRSFNATFRPASVDPELWSRFNKIATAAKNSRLFRESEGAKKATQIYVLLNKYGKEATDVELSKLLTAIEKPSTKIKLPEGLQEIATISREYLDELAKIRKSFGKSIIDQDDFKYLPHIHKQDFVDDLADWFGKSKVYSTTSPADKARDVFKFVDEAGNELLGKADEPAINLKKIGDNLFQAKDGTKYDAVLPTIEEKLLKYPRVETSLPKLVSAATTRTGKLEEAGIMLREVADLSVNMGGLDNFTKLSDAKLIKGIPELRGRKFHPELIREITKYHETLTSQKEIKSFIRLYDKTQNFWKARATFDNPAFHARNVVSSALQNFLGGVKTFTPIKKSMDIQGFLTRNQPMPKNLNRYWDLFIKNGLEESFFQADIQGNLLKQFQPRLIQATQRIGGPLDVASRVAGKVSQTGGKVGRVIERNARLTMFIDKIDKGFIPEEAAKLVKKFHFDYSDLSEFEKNVMKRVVPFYTWTRKNIPLQLQQLANKPRFAVGIIKAKTNIEKQVGIENIDQSLLPEWLQKSEPVILGQDEGKIKVAKLEGFIPITDIGLLSPSEILRQTLGMTSPFIKFLPQAAANYNFFLERQIQRFPGEKKDFLRLKVNPYLDFTLRHVRPLSELDKLIGKPHDDVSKVAKTINFVSGGKIYYIDKARQKRLNNFLKRKKLGTLKAAAKKANEQGDVEEFRRLMKLRQETQRSR